MIVAQLIPPRSVCRTPIIHLLAYLIELGAREKLGLRGSGKRRRLRPAETSYARITAHGGRLWPHGVGSGLAGRRGQRSWEKRQGRKKRTISCRLNVALPSFRFMHSIVFRSMHSIVWME